MSERPDTVEYTGRDYLSTAVILTAVEVETASVRAAFGGWKRAAVHGDHQSYYETFIENSRGERVRIVTAQQDVMGMTACTNLASKAINTFRPRYLIMCGIAAGTDETTTHMYGDVIVPDVVWDYTTGKYVGPDESEIRFGDIGFLPRPVSLRTDPDIIDLIKSTQNAPDNEFHVHIGPMACGSSVVANEEVVNVRIKALYPHTIGLDMESYSVSYAAVNASEPRPTAVIVKSICDYANAYKDDRFQRFAAYNSAGYVKYLLENYL